MLKNGSVPTKDMGAALIKVSLANYDDREFNFTLLKCQYNCSMSHTMGFGQSVLRVLEGLRPRHGQQAVGQVRSSSSLTSRRPP